MSTLAPKKKTPSSDLSSDLFFLIAALQATLEYQKISENIFDSYYSKRQRKEKRERAEEKGI